MLSAQGVRVIALGKRKSQVRAAERLGAMAVLDVSQNDNPIQAVRQLTEAGNGADAVIEAVGVPDTWQWTVNLFGGCPRGSHVQFDPSVLHYSEITIRSTFHHTPEFIRKALDTIARGEVRASDFVNAEIPLDELPCFFQHMKNRNGELKAAVIP